MFKRRRPKELFEAVQNGRREASQKLFQELKHTLFTAHPRIGKAGPQEQSRLAAKLGLKKYALTRLIQKLEFHGYLARARVG